MDKAPTLLDLHFADNILIFARSRKELGHLVGSLMIHWEQVGSVFNAEEAVRLTNEAQAPSIFARDGGLRLTILQRNVGQKWLGYMLTAARSQSQNIDFEYHLHPVYFYANR